MPDWTSDIRPHLASLGLEPARESAIIEELAQHLDDRYQELLASGQFRSEDEARRAVVAELNGGRARTFVGRAGTGDLVATALAPKSRNRSAGELLSQGVPAAEIPERLGQAVEALETVPLLARAIERAGLKAPITSALADLIDGTLPLDDWMALVRVSEPEKRPPGDVDLLVNRVVKHFELVLLRDQLRS